MHILLISTQKILIKCFGQPLDIHQWTKQSSVLMEFMFLREETDTEQIRDEKANQEISSRTRVMKSDGGVGWHSIMGSCSWVLCWGLQKVPKELQHCLGFPLENRLYWQIGFGFSVTCMAHLISGYRTRSHPLVSRSSVPTPSAAPWIELVWRLLLPKSPQWH